MSEEELTGKLALSLARSRIACPIGVRSEKEKRGMEKMARLIAIDIAATLGLDVSKLGVKP